MEHRENGGEREKHQDSSALSLLSRPVPEKRKKKKKKKKNVVVMKTVVADAQVCLANRADIGADGSFTGPDG
jgi:hypothetical protein